MRDLIHFAHGNGFPALCYSQLLEALHARYDYCYIDKIGHNPKFPVTENWHFLVDEIIDSVRTQATKPVIAIGHSLGGVLSLLAAIEHPSLFKAVIMLDSPLLGPFKSTVVRLAKSFGFIDKITPASRTRGRREVWQNREQLLLYLKTRKLFKSFSDECLQDYIDYGMKKTKNGYELLFDRDIEYSIYRTIPDKFSDYEGRLTLAAALIYGDKSNVVDVLDRRNMRKNYRIPSYKIKGSHMFPMERPIEVSEQVFKVLDAILKRSE
ncbi:MAG: alpha/beta hydrolase [Tatlockia sp.]|nr:alpha/beta hydrolase [Tatlockia sp.]